MRRLKRRRRIRVTLPLGSVTKRWLPLASLGRTRFEVDAGVVGIGEGAGALEAAGAGAVVVTDLRFPLGRDFARLSVDVLG